MTWLLRRATVDDVEAIMQIESTTFAADAWSTAAMLSEVKSRHTFYLVATSEGRTAIEGYVGLLAPRNSEQADIQTIAVVAEARRRGLGRALMNAAIAEARSRNAREIFLEVRADNPNAQALYESLGFEQLAVRPNYYQPEGIDAHVMRLTLTPPTVVTA